MKHMPPRNLVLIPFMPLCLLAFLGGCSQINKLDLGGGNGDPFNGGDPLYVAISIARKNIRAGAESVQRATDVASLCDYSACSQQSIYCKALRDLSPPQVTACRDFLRNNAGQFVSMNSSDPRIEPVKVNLAKGPLSGTGSEGTVTGVTTSDPKSPIFLDRDRAASLNASDLMVLLTHEFGHKVGGPNYVLDDVAFGGFNTGRQFLDTAGSALLAYLTDVIHLDLNGSTQTVNTGLAPKFLSLPNGDVMKVIRSQSQSGYVEVEIASRQSGYQIRKSAVTPYDLGFARVCDFELRQSDLVCILVRATGSGRVELHSLTAASDYSSYEMHLAINHGAFPENVDWDYMFSGDELVMVKRNNTGSGNMEFHVLSPYMGYSQYVEHVALDLPEYSAAEYEVVMVGSDAALIRTKNLRRHIEYQIRSRASHFLETKSVGSLLIRKEEVPDFQWSSYQGDIMGIEFQNTQSSKVEFSVFSGANYFVRVMQVPSIFLIR